MTGWFEENVRKGNIRPSHRSHTTANDKIIITDNNDAVKSYECSYCQHIIRTRKTDGTISCPNCTAELVIEDTRKKSKLEIPRGRGGSNDIYVGTTPAPVSPFAAKEVEYKGGFLELQRRGLHITSYSETDGAGRPISQWKRQGEEDEE